MKSFLPICFIIGILLIVLGIAMAIPGILEIFLHNHNWLAFISSSAFTITCGAVLALGSRVKFTHVSMKQAFCITTLSWSVLSAFAAIPLYISPIHASYAAAYFEAMSGLTTTGATAFSHVDLMPWGVLLWRSLLHWIGGIGIVVIAVAILPILKVNGMQLIKTEFTDTIDKELPKAVQIATSLILIYVVLSALCAIFLWIAGMSTFDAINYAMSAVSTGGFATHDSSLGYYHNQVYNMILVVFMIAGSLPFLVYLQAILGKPTMLYKNSQIQWFFGVLATATLLVYLGRILNPSFHGHLGDAFCTVLFNVTSLLTCTGLVYTNYGAWGHAVLPVILLVTLLGGCSGSTASGLKMFHLEVLYQVTKAQIKQLIRPHGIFHIYYNKKPVPINVVQSVLGLFFVYCVTYFIFSILFSFTGLDFISSFSTSATLLANTGPGLGDLVGPSGNFSVLSPLAMWLSSLEMLLGRLDIFTVVVLFSPIFWEK